ncbi:DUF2911 domain-containing protein [Flavobacterium sufflavum]|uniref:DUF2911 domain-containing protein n=1 Tax=Flavobacterium sufflavum TaxID=1921138 RepID=A0A437KYR2_9FLAO|nr:DUF2911 domain-containing protein [Flavobacterium sufflavum]RVT77589.1 DUF2911 domain-containing protein [Flavobacterium sufflavum]
MKTFKFISAVAFGFLLLLATNTQAQKFPGLDKSPMDQALFPADNKIPTKTAKVIYSRPQLKGRALSELTPAGKVWRTGANEATEITFYKDVNLGKTKIKAGSYSLYTIPGEKEWTIILNKDINIWGAYSYKEANDVARLVVPATQAEESLEAFSMVFTKADNGMILNLGWDKTRVAIPFTE